jgi:hypothetical protein
MSEATAGKFAGSREVVVSTTAGKFAGSREVVVSTTAVSALECSRRHSTGGGHRIASEQVP